MTFDDAWVPAFEDAAQVVAPSLVGPPAGGRLGRALREHSRPQRDHWRLPAARRVFLRHRLLRTRILAGARGWRSRPRPLPWGRAVPRRDAVRRVPLRPGPGAGTRSSPRSTSSRSEPVVISPVEQTQGTSSSGELRARFAVVARRPVRPGGPGVHDAGRRLPRGERGLRRRARGRRRAAGLDLPRDRRTPRRDPGRLAGRDGPGRPAVRRLRHAPGRLLRPARRLRQLGAGRVDRVPARSTPTSWPATRSASSPRCWSPTTAGSSTPPTQERLEAFVGRPGAVRARGRWRWPTGPWPRAA